MEMARRTNLGQVVNSGNVFLASLSEVPGGMITSSPGFQRAGVITLCSSATWRAGYEGQGPPQNIDIARCSPSMRLVDTVRRQIRGLWRRNEVFSPEYLIKVSSHRCGVLQ